MRKDIDGDSFMGIRGTLTTLPHYFSSGLYALTAKLNLWLPASWIPQPTSHIPHPTTYILGYVNQSAALGPVSWYFVPVWEIPVFVRPVRSCQQKHRDALTAQYRQKCSWWAVAAVGETGQKSQTTCCSCCPARTTPSAEMSLLSAVQCPFLSFALHCTALLMPPHFRRRLCPASPFVLRPMCVFANFISKIVLVPKYPLAQLRVLL